MSSIWRATFLPEQVSEALNMGILNLQFGKSLRSATPAVPLDGNHDLRLLHV
ncbi:hypothetical protein VFPBJ_09731 [Purpureocillium lilacinum]|uniref:Uncharacterized protein n=1 Tax=Purpureocillium lilacinum TaxID=33203 RepID=A0A179G9E3_PURLI|nr:hypothetical protein VFPBJ_09731 [Purpureocillium lilacinum]